HPYAAVGAALAAFDSALHGAASVAAERLLRDAMEGDAAGAISRALAASNGIPGFGHAVYRRRDPRADMLFGRMARLPAYRAPMRAAERLAAVVSSRLDRPANVDLALAVLAVGAGFPPGGAQALFALARSAGWIAHAADEYRQAPLRLRAESRYIGPA
ncbi:citrate/2-methylcitrate synthase, partial [Mesorhizobium japonicum]|uniref:citrate/2-methylcitrate synthase n=1 Tax=Mesorhizobium japonicum TaxID=2066070 RepID=UPI003B5BD989